MKAARTTIVNVRYYSLGLAGNPLFQTGGVPGNDGNPPTAADYDAAYVVIDIENLEDAFVALVRQQGSRS